MTDKEEQELVEATTTLRLAGFEYYAQLLERIGKHQQLKCECSVRDGSNPDCPVHQVSCPACGCAPSYDN